MNVSALRSRRDRRADARKALLYCPTCGHESPTDGDWTRREESDRVVYSCPDCEATLTTRRRF
jgi:predicted RNA-binding Zn-ribbon protein involved in translation (DUF1610 family)